MGTGADGAKAREARAALEAEQETADLRSLLADARFRRVAARLFESLGLFESTYRYGARPHDLAFSAGLRGAAVRIYDRLMAADASLTQKAIQERTEEEMKWRRS